MPIRVKISMLSALLLASVASASWAASSAHDHGARHVHHTTKNGSPSTNAYKAAMVAMHRDMELPLAGDVNIDFARQMIPHHQGAVAMAKVELQYGHDKEMQDFARWVIRAQEPEIGNMKNWLQRRDNGAQPPQAHAYYADAMENMHHAMMIDYTGDADVDFARGMIPHHQGAIAMASIYLAKGNDPDLNQLANGIYDSQNYEIAWMERWLAKHSKPSTK